jgi:hypothetical protein
VKEIFVTGSNNFGNEFGNGIEETGNSFISTTAKLDLKI